LDPDLAGVVNHTQDGTLAANFAVVQQELLVDNSKNDAVPVPYQIQSLQNSLEHTHPVRDYVAHRANSENSVAAVDSGGGVAENSVAYLAVVVAAAVTAQHMPGSQTPDFVDTYSQSA